MFSTDFAFFFDSNFDQMHIVKKSIIRTSCNMFALGEEESMSFRGISEN